MNSDASICDGFPIYFGGSVYGQPAIGNIDDDDALEIILTDDDEPLVYCYDLGSSTFPALMPWRQFQHDSWHTGCYGADNTIPAPPTNLQVEQTDEVSMVLTWDLSVNDPYAPSPEEPADVISYQIYRGYPPSTRPILIGRVHAGIDMYNDICDPWGPQVEYYLSASDGTYQSSPSNIVRVRIESTALISRGCSVTEEFGDVLPAAATVRTASGISSSRADAAESAVLSSSAEAVSESLRGNPSCLTDGSLEETYTPSHGAESVVIDLGEECSVTAVIPQRQPAEQSDVAGTVSVTDTQDDHLRIEVAGVGRIFELLDQGTRRSMEGIRYVRVHDASGLAEISVYGTRSSASAEPLSLEVVENHDSEGWSFAIPLEMLEAGGSGELSVKIFDMTGRMVWSGRTDVGNELHWDGRSNGTPVPSGVYLLQCTVGTEVSTGSFVVRRD